MSEPPPPRRRRRERRTLNGVVLSAYVGHRVEVRLKRGNARCAGVLDDVDENGNLTLGWCETAAGIKAELAFVRGSHIRLVVLPAENRVEDMLKRAFELRVKGMGQRQWITTHRREPKEAGMELPTVTEWKSTKGD